MSQPHSLLLALDATAITATFATALGWLPPATTVLTFLYILIRLFETNTVQKWLNRKNGERQG